MALTADERGATAKRFAEEQRAGEIEKCRAGLRRLRRYKDAGLATWEDETEALRLRRKICDLETEVA